MYTILRDETTSREDYVFFSDRLSTFLVEKAMEKLPYRDRIVETPVGVKAVGKEIDVEVSLVELK